MTEPRKYRLIDWYDSRYVVGNYDTMLEANRAARQYEIEECDGECRLALYKFNPTTGKYHKILDWHF